MKVLQLFFVTLSVFACSVLHSSEPSSPAFWEVTKGKSTVYLMGSMHSGRPDFYPLPKEIETAFSSSEKLVVEVDITRLDPAASMQAVYKYAAMPAGKSLSSALSPELGALLEKHCKQHQVPCSAFEAFQPWFVAMQLVEAELKKTDFKPTLGIDWYFLGRARAVQDIDELETLDSQMKLFSQFSVEEQALFLKQTLLDLKESQSFLNEMAENWRRGNAAALEEQLLEPFREQKETKALFEALFTTRNQSMALAVERYLLGDEDVFFVVGAGHMVGKQGIVDLLTNKGYKVNRVSFGQL